MKNIMLLSLWLALFLLRPSFGSEKIFVFGDSLSDTGNSFAITQLIQPTQPAPLPPPPYGNSFDKTGSITGYFPGRFTDGQNWVDYFPGVAASFGFDIAAPIAAYGPGNTDDNATNFAVGGSTSGNLNVLSKTLPSFPDQIDRYVARFGGKSDTDDLCVIWIGANDFSAGVDPVQTVANIRDGISKLSRAGARTFAVINIPDLALTPHVKALDGATILAARRFVFTTNILLEVELLRFAFLRRINIQIVDINAIFVPLVCQPSRFGFANSIMPALVALASNPQTNPNDYVFWDDFHPTTKAHYIAARFIYSALFSGRHFHEFLSFR